MKQTKGLAESALALLIIAIITMGSLGVFVYKYSQRQTCMEKVELCRTSISFNSAYKKALGKGQAFSPVEPKIDCPICVPDSSSEIKDQKEDEAMREIANHLRWCWHKTTGKDNLIGKKTVEGFRFCLVCSEFTIDIPINGQKFLNFLHDTKITNGPGAGSKYAQYLDTNWGIGRILDYSLLIEKNYIAGYIPETQALQPELKKAPNQVSITANKKYQVIDYDWAFSYTVPFNQVIIIPNDDVANLPCDIYHYQKE